MLDVNYTEKYLVIAKLFTKVTKYRGGTSGYHNSNIHAAKNYSSQTHLQLEPKISQAYQSAYNWNTYSTCTRIIPTLKGANSLLAHVKKKC